MVFNSLPFLVFYVLVTTSFFLLKHKYRWILLLAASCYFYIVFVPIYILILGGTIVIDFFAGIYLEKISEHKKRKRFLILSLMANIGVLAVFKYYNFFAFNVNSLFDSNAPVLSYLKILLPIGLSFHTFQAMSYTIEVYRGNQKAERHFGIYALYVMFYPQLVAGPIERPQNTLHQFHEKQRFNFDNLKAGLMQMAVGFFKKVVIADRLALLVDGAYSHPKTQSPATLLIATLFYGFQIYCDFSGYTDIGIGAARTMGFRLMENFRAPYFSRTISEFWSRWHISLSTWFRDYVYIPLGGNRVAVPRWYLNLFIVFVISGLWHGANWTFIIWGALHGAFLILHNIKNRFLQASGYDFKPNFFKRLVQILSTYAAVSFAWIFFRANTVGDAWFIVKSFTHVFPATLTHFTINQTEVWFSIALIVLLCLKEWFFLVMPTKNTAVFIFTFTLIAFSCYFLGVFNNKQFIYFQF